MIALIVVALGAVVAAVGTGVLTARATQMPRIYFFAWTIALFGLAIGLGAATVGYLAGFGELIFRAMELGAQLLAPLALCLAMTETGGRGLPARFAMRLAVSGLAVIGLVILGSDPLNPNVTFGTGWPDPTVVYQIAPLTVLGLLALFTFVTSVCTVILSIVRSSRERTPREEGRPLVLVGVAAMFLSLPGISWLLDKGAGIALPLPSKDLFALGCAVAAVLVFYAARMAGQRNLGQIGLRAAAHRADDDQWDDGYGRGPRYSRPPYETGEFDPDYRGRRRAQDGPLYDEPNSEINYPGLAALAAEHDDDRIGADRRRSEDQYGDSGAFDSAAFDSAAFDSAAFDSAAFDSGAFDGPYGRPEPPDDSDGFAQPTAGHVGWDNEYPAGAPDDLPGQMFGQITIYTLLDGRIEEFDRLTEWVVAQVRAKEPDTLVYIVHAVPTAPMQRILYEVYRDRVAHDQHLLRSYVQTYQAEQRPYVLATNVIELDLQQAKVSPLPTFSAISDMLSESGIDLTGITKSSPAPFGYQRALPGPAGPGGTPYDDRPPYEDHGQQPYERQRYERQRYDREDYDEPGFEGRGLEGRGFGEPEPERREYRRRGYSESDYDRPEFDRPEFDRDGHRRADYDQRRHAEPEYDEPGYERPYQGGWAEINGEDSRY